MRELIVWIQARVDGRVHTGIDLDGSTVWEEMEETTEEADPTLLWFVDLRCNGKNLPEGIEDTRAWLLEHAELVQDALRQMAAGRDLGFDHDIWPFQWKVRGAPRGVRMTLVCSSLFREDARKLGQVLKDVAQKWPTYVKRMKLVPTHP